MKVAVIGSGYWGKNLVRVFSELGALHTVCDLNEASLRAIKSAYPSASLSSSYKKVLADKEINGVVISSPAVTHYKLAKEGLLAGKDVFVEKPLALTAEEGAELADIAKKEHRILMVGHLLEYHPGILKLKSLMDKGALGNINYIYSNRLNLGKIRREENILWSFAPHDISVILLLLGQMPVAVSAYGGNYLHKNVADVTVSNLEFKSGVRGHIFVSWLHPYKEHKLVVIGDKKMALFDDVEKKDKLRLYNYSVNMSNGVPVHSKDEAEAVSFETSEPLKEECGHFLHCLKTRQTPKTDGQSGIRVLKVLQACQESLEKRGGDKREL
jgi:UDP-2-acetamido-3-amino-2,3-dideoxy-glucuronate N-acetyltransferase